MVLLRKGVLTPGCTHVHTPQFRHSLLNLQLYLSIKTSHSSPCKYFLVLGSFVVPFVLPLTRKGRKSDYGYNNMRSVCFVFFGIIDFIYLSNSVLSLPLIGAVE